jgi:hypothetical protein
MCASRSATRVARSWLSREIILLNDSASTGERNSCFSTTRDNYPLPRYVTALQDQPCSCRVSPISSIDVRLTARFLSYGMPSLDPVRRRLHFAICSRMNAYYNMVSARSKHALTARKGTLHATDPRSQLHAVMSGVEE